MAVRVSAGEVQQILGDCNTTDEVIESIIVDANGLINSLLSDCDGLTEQELKSIEKWLSAHLVASSVCRDIIEEELGEARIKYTGKFGEKLMSTRYGQMVLALDTCGALGKAGKQSAKIRAITSFE